MGFASGAPQRPTEQDRKPLQVTPVRFNWRAVAVVLMAVAAAALLAVVIVSMGCSQAERITLTRAGVEAAVAQGVVELKATFGISLLEMQNQIRELIWDTFYKITGVGAGGTAAIVGHRYTKSYKNVQAKAVTGG